MKKTYLERLKIPVDGSESMEFFTKSGTKVATGYERVVIGDRGPYIEFKDDQVLGESFYIPKDQAYRITDKRVYYIEARTNDESYVKLYMQRRTVAYADYKIGMLYMSPFELKTEEFDELVETNVEGGTR